MSTNSVPKHFFLPLRGISSDVTYTQKIVSGLGKSTKRGIKKCFRCGVYNGTRSTLCKNKRCGVILKDSEEKSKIDFDAVKLLTGTEKQVYSVRVRDMGPDYRGFVQLPLLQLEEDTSIFSEVALCFVDSCQNSFDNSILKCHEEDQNGSKLVCAHIKSALRSQSTASPINFKDHALHLLKVSDHIKEKLYLLATEKEGYLVQRVSKSIMAVKCQVSPKHPLGYLHFTFIKGKGKDLYEKYYCSCTEFTAPSSIKGKIIYNKCIHYYACIWALASSVKYSNEFSHFVNSELPQSEALNYQLTDNSIKKVNLETPTKEKNKHKCKDISKVTKKFKKREIIKKCQRIMPKVLPIEIKVLSDVPSGEENISWTFIDWLSYVTESINKTMQFENYGIINTLIFQAPQTFFNSFSKKIPSIYNPEINDVIVTYKIMNILHLKEIFDTSGIKLKISKKFVHTEQNGYVEYNESEETNDSYQCSFIFFLNVGQSTVDESDNTNNPFTIEWIPTITTLTNVGQLKLQYKYGRKST